MGDEDALVVCAHVVGLRRRERSVGRRAWMVAFDGGLPASQLTLIPTDLTSTAAR